MINQKETNLERLNSVLKKLNTIRDDTNRSIFNFKEAIKLKKAGQDEEDIKNYSLESLENALKDSEKTLGFLNETILKFQKFIEDYDSFDIKKVMDHANFIEKRLDKYFESFSWDDSVDSVQEDVNIKQKFFTPIGSYPVNLSDGKIDDEENACNKWYSGLRPLTLKKTITKKIQRFLPGEKQEGFKQIIKEKMSQLDQFLEDHKINLVITGNFMATCPDKQKHYYDLFKNGFEEKIKKVINVLYDFSTNKHNRLKKVRQFASLFEGEERELFEEFILEERKH